MSEDEDDEGVLSVANERAGAMRRQIQTAAAKSLGEDDERVLLRTTVGNNIPLSDQAEIAVKRKCDYVINLYLYRLHPDV
jgi:hypothetical protein